MLSPCRGEWIGSTVVYLTTGETIEFLKRSIFKILIQQEVPGSLHLHIGKMQKTGGNPKDSTWSIDEDTESHPPTNIYNKLGHIVASNN